MLPPVVKSGGLPLEQIYAAVSQSEGAHRPARAPSCRAASSRCWPSPASCAPGAKLLLLDEPTEGLAPVIVQQIGNTIRMLREQGFTILLVEQNFRFAATVADRHYVVEHGRVIDMIPNAALEANREKLQDLSRCVDWKRKCHAMKR